jgi:LytR cell envelope-related transcriptional attenuator
VTAMAFPRGRGRSPWRNLVATAARGAILIGLAVAIGLVLLQVVDDAGGGGGGGTASGGGGGGGTVTTTAPAGGSTTTTTAAASPNGARPASQVAVQVLNGSGVQGAANQRSNDLKAKGYQVLPAGNAPAPRTGTAVQCKKGYEKEAAALVTVLGTLAIKATVEPFPNPAPVGPNAQANCLVILGK